MVASFNYLRWIDIEGRVQVCSQKFPDWPPGTRTANGSNSLPLGTVVSRHSSEFCRHKHLCYF
jgi:hypothetical protein